MALPLGTDVEYVGQNASGGMSLGASSTELVSLHGATPIAQAAAIASLTASTTLTQLVVIVQTLTQTLKDKGITA